jgi:hypothetical protein
MTLLIEGLLIDRLIQQVERRTEAERGRADGLRTLENAGRDWGELMSKYKMLQDERDRITMTRDRLIADNKAWDEKSEKVSCAIDALCEAARAYLAAPAGRSKSGLASSLRHKIGEAEKMSDSWGPF